VNEASSSNKEYCYSSEVCFNDRCWKEYFSNPSLWWNNRNNKKNPKALDFKHKISKEALWIDG
jgi:hypothetical protein